MDFAEYTAACTKTESVLPDSIRIDDQTVSHVIDAAIATSNMLDVIKKRVFYGRETNKNGDPISVDLRGYASTAQYCTEIIVDEAGAYIPETETTVNLRYFHGVVGLVTECGELLDSLQKTMSGKKALDTVNVLEELGDVMWYVAILCDTFGLDFNQILERNVAKLQKRYGGSFTSDAANNRDLDAELKILEGDDGTEYAITSLWKAGVFQIQEPNAVEAFAIDLTNAINQDIFDEAELLTDFEESVKRGLEYMKETEMDCEPCERTHERLQNFYDQVSSAWELLEAVRNEDGSSTIRSGGEVTA